MIKNKKITYKQSGVDIVKANRFVSGIARMVQSTQSPAVLNRHCAFGSLFSLDHQKYKDPVLVSSTDGVGTKLLLAKALGKHDTVGIDLVAMNVNDILCAGAKPLFFLDYIACGKVQLSILNDVMKGIVDGCHQAGCSLIGGETAEMPGMYKDDEYDLAGFTVGVVEKIKIIDGQTMSVGDKILGLASSGLHSNGFSLVRKVLTLAQQKKHQKELLEPTRIYVEPVLKALGQFPIKGIAHITGGAYYEKLTKIVPEGKCFNIYKESWPIPSIFKLIQQKGRVPEVDMYKTFNMGIGLAIVVEPKVVDALGAFFKKQNLSCWVIGDVREGTDKVKFLS